MTSNQLATTSRISSSPTPKSQGLPLAVKSQNRNCEVSHCHLCAQAREWLVDDCPPGEFWCFALSHSAQVHDHLPAKTQSGEITTHFFEAFQTKPDCRKLSPVFSAACVKGHDSLPHTTLPSQTVPTVLAGNDDVKSEGHLFCSPTTKQLQGSSNHASIHL